MIKRTYTERTVTTPRAERGIQKGESVEVTNIYSSHDGKLYCDVAVTAEERSGFESTVFTFKWLPLEEKVERIDGSGKTVRGDLYDVVLQRAKDALRRASQESI